jgi:hypothetical protein
LALRPKPFRLGLIPRSIRALSSVRFEIPAALARSRTALITGSFATTTGTRCVRAAASAFVQFRTVRTLSALGFCEFSDDAPVAAVEIPSDRLALCLNAKSALALLARADAIVANKTAGMWGCQDEIPI